MVLIRDCDDVNDDKLAAFTFPSLFSDLDEVKRPQPRDGRCLTKLVIAPPDEPMA
jgi:hypothetical protein